MARTTVSASKSPATFLLRLIEIDLFLLCVESSRRVVRRAGPRADEPIWPQTRMTLHTKVTPVIAEAGIAGGPHATPKGIRHGFFVHAIRRRILLTRLQRWMGHSELNYTVAHVEQLMLYAPELLGNDRADAERLW